MPASVPRDVDDDDDDKEAFCVVIENEIGNHLSHSQVSQAKNSGSSLYYQQAAVDNDRHHYSILSYSYATYLYNGKKHPHHAQCQCNGAGWSAERLDEYCPHTSK